MALGDRVAVLRDGALQQVDTPRRLYELPANAFVASFVGTPRINLLHGTVHAPIDGSLSVSLGAQHLPLPQPLTHDHQMLRVVQSRPLLIGLRPEAVRIAEHSQVTPFERPLTGVVEHIEFQGHEALLHLSLGGRQADVPPQPLPQERHKPPRNTTADLTRRLLHRVRTAKATRSTHEKHQKPQNISKPKRSGIGELIVRTTPGTPHRRRQHIPLLVDVRSLLVFDEHGDRISPAPARTPDI